MSEPSGGWLRHRLRDDLPTIVMACTIFTVCWAVMRSQGIEMRLASVVLNARLYLAGIAVMLAADMAWALLRHMPASPVAFLKARYISSGLVHFWTAGVPMMVTLIVLMPFFSKVKSMIPLFSAYSWDATFVAWDQALFFGHDAWRVLQPLFGYPFATFLISLCYQLWLLLIYPGCIYLCFYPVDAKVRRAFFLTFVLSWTVIGTAMAIAFASVGPCFIEPIFGNDHFAEQMQYLREVDRSLPIMALPVQDLLLEWYRAGSQGLGRGISAMPSMHVAVAFLFYLAMRRVSRQVGTAFFIFFVIVFIGSVHLAYHYAVDGLVSIVATALLWKLSWRFFEVYDAWRPKSPRMEEAKVG